MKTYKLKTGSFEGKKKAILTQGISLIIIALSGVFAISIINAGFDWKVFLFTLSAATVASFFGIKRGLKTQKEAWESYTLQWDMNQITKSQIRTKDVSIQKKDILSIIENQNGVVLKSNQKMNAIFIPKELENFNELISELKP